MVEAAHKYNRIVQHGVQLRSSEAIREAVGHLRKGTIGNVYMARGLVFRWRPSIGHKGVEAVPGRARTTTSGRAPRRWSPSRAASSITTGTGHWNYGNGDVGNQGIHETDMCMWGLGVESFPNKITAMGGKFLFDDDKETPEVLTSTYLYPDQKKIIEFEVRPWCTNDEGGAGVGNIFYGSEGYMVIKGYDTYEVFLGQKREKGPVAHRGRRPLRQLDQGRRAAARPQTRTVRSRPRTSSSGLAHLGNISYRLGRQLEFDPATEKFVGDTRSRRHADPRIPGAVRRPQEGIADGNPSIPLPVNSSPTIRRWARATCRRLWRGQPRHSGRGPRQGLQPEARRCTPQRPFFEPRPRSMRA